MRIGTEDAASASACNLRVEKTRRFPMADYASLLQDHVTLTCRCIDRIFLQAYVPKT